MPACRPIHARGLWFLIVCLAGISFAQTTVEVRYSHRLVSHIDPPADGFAEGGIVATFQGSGPITPDPIDPELVQVDERTYTYTFPWNWVVAKVVRFVDDDGAEILAGAWPHPIHPCEPGTHTFPVIQIRVDTTGLWDPDTGIYVWGNNDNCLQRGSEWERPAVLRYCDGVHIPVAIHPIGMRIHGGWSRCLDQKGLRFYFDRDDGVGPLTVPVFGDGPSSFRRLLARTHRTYNRCYVSNLAEGLFQDLGHLGSRGRYVSVYLNGEYWGNYTLKERYDDEFVEHTHAIDDPYVLIKDGETEHGDGNRWWSFLDSFAGVTDPTDHAWFADVADSLDLEAYIDWLFINIHGAAADNGGSGNLALLKIDSQPWRFLMWDEDDLYRPANLQNDHFRWYSAITESEYEQFRPPDCYSGSWSSRQPWYRLFYTLMQNSEFKALFRRRVETLLAGRMSPASLQARLDSLAMAYEPEQVRHAERWNWSSPSNLNYSMDQTRSFFSGRHGIVSGQFADFMALHRDPVELSEFSALPVGPGAVRVSWHTEAESGNLGWILWRGVGGTEDMEVIASYETHAELVGQAASDEPTDYQFIDLAPATNAANIYRLQHVDHEEEVHDHAWYETAIPTGFAGMVINELMACNTGTVADDQGEYDDWFEVHNTGLEPVLLDSLWVTDDPGRLRRHQFRGGHTVQPGGHLLLWADGSVEQGDDHCSFSLSSSGEFLAILGADGCTIIDSVSFGPLAADVALARKPDGATAWQATLDPTPAAPNGAPVAAPTLCLNEFLAENETGLQDENGEFDDWLEIHNHGPDAVDLAGLYLTDDLDNPFAWALPAQTLAAGDFLIVWCDDDEDQGLWHASFKLSGDGESIGLFAGPTRGNLQLDCHEFARQTADVGEGRSRDGGLPWIAFSRTTPGCSNNPGTGSPPGLSGSLPVLSGGQPNPFNPATRLDFSLPRSGPVLLTIHDVRGRLIRTLHQGYREAGCHQAVWHGDDEHGLPVASGPYLVLLRFAGATRTSRIMLVR